MYSCSRVKPLPIIEENSDDLQYFSTEKSIKLKNNKTAETPIFGYRFRIEGDFNGNGFIDTLTEHFYSQLTMTETNKFYRNLTDFEQFSKLNASKKPLSFISSNNSYIDTLFVASNKQMTGLSFLKNEGDLNDDNIDELSYVINWADFSNINTYHIFTYTNDSWTELYHFPIWEWQLPTQDILTYNNSHNNNTTDNFTGLVTKLETNKIQVIYRNENAERDTQIVRLATPRK